MENPPDKKLNSSDKGAETLKRFRYQITYSAILSLSLIDDNSNTQEIFCEHHEDVLIKLTNGKFVGVQVKTKDLDLGPFHTSDPEIEKTIVRFVKLDSEFENKFSFLTIVSNTGFYCTAKTFKNLSYLIDLAKNNKNDELLKNRSKSKTWIKKISKEAKCDERKVISVLSKIVLKGKKAGLDYITSDLRERLDKIYKLCNQTFGVLNSISEGLIQKHFNASSLLNKHQVTESFLSSTTPKDGEIKRILDSKVIRPDDIWGIINKFLEEPISLFLKDCPDLNSFPIGTKKLELKMDAGGISYDNIKLQKDNKFSAENHFVSWVYKDNTNKAEGKYNQIQLIIRNECQEAHDEYFEESELFGTKMLIDTRKRLKNRYSSEKGSFFDCKYEHLMGMAAILTEECTVWWSKKFEIK